MSMSDRIYGPSAIFLSLLGFSHSLVTKDYLNKGERAKHVPFPAGSLDIPTVVFFY